MNYLLKTFLKIIQIKIPTTSKLQQHLGFGTEDTVFAVQNLFENCRDVNCDLLCALWTTKRRSVELT